MYLRRNPIIIRYHIILFTINYHSFDAYLKSDYFQLLLFEFNLIFNQFIYLFLKKMTEKNINQFEA